MSRALPSPLPAFDRNLLRMVERVVPLGERAEWVRTWEAELWHVHHRRRAGGTRRVGETADLSAGLLRDAMWLRCDDWRRRFDGTVALCLGTLAGLCVLSGLIGLVVDGGWRGLRVALGEPLERCVVAALLVVFVSFATAPRRHTESHAMSKAIYWTRRQVFFAAKILLIVMLGFLLSVDVCGPVHAALPVTSELLQMLCFVVMALFGLRWAFADQDQRCKQCLRALAMPARVGRPSHNLLEWNGTELVCKDGHGLLSVPEMETSWCQASEWVYQLPGWDGTASV